MLQIHSQGNPLTVVLPGYTLILGGNSPSMYDSILDLRLDSNFRGINVPVRICNRVRVRLGQLAISEILSPTVQILYPRKITLCYMNPLHPVLVLQPHRDVSALSLPIENKVN